MWSMPQEPVQHGVMLINPSTGIAKLEFNCPNPHSGKRGARV